MIEGIGLQNYRGFSGYQIVSFNRVNLLVGRNNSGKTSILEAIQLLASGGDISVLTNIAIRRGEVAALRDDIEPPPYRRSLIPDVRHFFHGRSFEVGSTFRLRVENSLTPLMFSVGLPDAEKQPLFRDYLEFGPLLAFEIKGSTSRRMREFPSIPVTDEGALFIDALRRVPSPPLGLVLPQFVTPESLGPYEMREMWDHALLVSNEQLAINALRILEPSLSEVFFLSSERTPRSRGDAGVVFGVDGRRFPMGSFGDGMRRMLALALSLTRAAGGVLLVDEIDTGLHWSVLVDMWRLMVSAARDTGTQVFATTHSLDCLRGLAGLCDAAPELAELVSVHRIDAGMEQAVSFSASEIQLAVEQEIEVR